MCILSVPDDWTSVCYVLLYMLVGVQVVLQLSRILAANATGLPPQSKYAVRVMRFFLGSLRNRHAPPYQLRLRVCCLALSPCILAAYAQPVALEHWLAAFCMHHLRAPDRQGQTGGLWMSA